MEFVPFYSLYEDIALRETRGIVIKASDVGIPLGKYIFIEYYCTDDTCDCRKVMLNVVDAKKSKQILATIGYGWESLAFYTKWMYGDTQVAQGLIGAYLEPGGIQSAYAKNLLEIFETRVTKQDIAAFIQHYKLWKKIR